jgi:cytochrome c peroxidase
VVAAVTMPAEGLAPPKDTLPTSLSIDLIPAGLDPNRPVPNDNPLSAAKVQLGRRLFFDPILSGNRTVSCASCHQPEHGFSSPLRFAIGHSGKQGQRNPPSLLNRAYGRAFFWDGREATLESQAVRPIESPGEMGSTLDEIIRRLQAHADYSAQFRAMFPDGVTAANIGKALACFERVLLSGNSRVDRFRRGEIAALSDSERHGLWLYESRGGCWRCHGGPNFTDEGFHNTGVSWGSEPLDLGRYAVTRQEIDRGRFKTPTLRGLAATAPYMHDGSLATLREVVEFYNRGGGKNPHLDPVIAPLGLSAEEATDLVAFLNALSEPVASHRLQP